MQPALLGHMFYGYLLFMHGCVVRKCILVDLEYTGWSLHTLVYEYRTGPPLKHYTIHRLEQLWTFLFFYRWQVYLRHAASLTTMSWERILLVHSGYLTGTLAQVLYEPSIPSKLSSGANWLTSIYIQSMQTKHTKQNSFVISRRYETTPCFFSLCSTSYGFSSFFYFR